MGNLEKVIQLKQQGQTDTQIIDNLKQQGVSPKEIEEILSQSEIKSAFSEQNATSQQGATTPQGTTAQQGSPNQQDTTTQQTPPVPKSTQEIPAQTPPQTTPQSPATMQPSMMQSTPEPPQQKIQQQPTSQFAQQMQNPQPTFQQSPLPIPSAPFQESLEQEYPPESQYSEYQPQQINDIETINEIAEQIIDEKTNQIKEQITSFSGFKEETVSTIERLNERLLKIENTLNEIQVAILRKVGDYGQDIQNIAKEMHSTQDSFSKILNPLTDNIRDLQKITGSKTSKHKRPKPEPSKPKTKSSKTNPEKTKLKPEKKKSKPSFEDYLR